MKRERRPGLFTSGGAFDARRTRMAQGTVKWFNGTKGFGFIAPADGGAELFVHESQVQDYEARGLAENEQVEFEVGEGRKGPQAMAVRVL
jgi:CspA family cold shock protein